MKPNKLFTALFATGLSLSVFASDIAELTRKAEQGDITAQVKLAAFYHKKQDYINEFKWTKKLAEQGWPASQYNLGVMYNNGQGVKQDYTEAVKWFTKAAEQGYADAQYNLGVMYYNGQGVKQDYIQAKKWYEKAVAQKHAAATTNLGYLYGNGYGTRLDKYKARELYGKGCDLGNQIGCDNYNIMKDMFLVESAESLLERIEKESKEREEKAERERQEEAERKKQWAAERIEKGKADFEANLAKVEKNPKDAEALYQLGDYYNRGWGVEEDKRQAVEWMTKAAEQGNVEAQYWLGIHWLGWIKEYDYETKEFKYRVYGSDIAQGIQYLTQATKHNHSYAQTVLGLQYLNGETVRQDLYKAKELFGLACDNGNKKGCENYRNEKLQNLPEINPLEKIFGEYWQMILGGIGALGLMFMTFLLGKRSKNISKTDQTSE